MEEAAWISSRPSSSEAASLLCSPILLVLLRFPIGFLRFSQTLLLLPEVDSAAGAEGKEGEP